MCRAPAGPSGTSCSATATCTTKARWVGNRDWDARCVCTCLFPLRWTLLHVHGDVVKMLAVQAGQSPQKVLRFLSDAMGHDVQEKQAVGFGPYQFEPHNAQLRRGRRVVPLTRKASQVLQCLVAQPGQLVTKEALFQAVWPETVVSEGVLANCIAELRQALGDTARRPRFIATVHRQGYRFLAPLSPLAPARSPASSAPERASASGARPLIAPLPVPRP
jgi:DNA-binding winged helix-turn-helix (wHTH) protein